MSDLPIHVCGDRVLIQVDREAQAVEQSDGGILIAKTMAAAVDGEDARESWYQGTVIAVGDEHPPFDVRPFVLRRLRELDVFRADAHRDGYEYDAVDADEIKALVLEIEALPTERQRDFAIGDRVVFSHTAGEQVDINDQRYLILRERDILGVLNG